ncbi:glycosyltransferase family 39 protein [Dapis sp. BLCC M126]|uniref:glycosyltransferase family 39 protein n=1 Tax=Dapis sp. BLCC M126 TaxID=3400189 RepID=UPI003CF56743
MFQQKPYFTWLKIFIAITLILGICFRFINIDRKVYWYDETITSLRIASYTRGEFDDLILNTGTITVEKLRQYQEINSEKNTINLISSLARDNPEHVPIYFVLLRWWVKLFGNSVAVIRNFSAITSLLIFPCIYWLCRELFGKSLVGWLAISLAAISPILVLYAQEARAYTLFSVAVLLSSIALLRAMRINSKRTWKIYIVSLIFALYTNLFSVLVAFSHGLYVILIEKFKLTQKFKAYLLASLYGFLGFLPWLILIITHFDGISWISKNLPLSNLFKRWFINLGFTFFDIQVGSSERLFDVKTLVFDNNALLQLNTIWPYILALVLILVIYSIYFLLKNAPRQATIFILTLMAVTPVCLIIPDLISGGQRSTIPRYLIPAYLGIQLSVAYLLGTKLSDLTNQIQHKFWQVVTITVISLGIISCGISSQAETWWNKYSSYYDAQVAKIINQTSQPLIISNHSGRLAILGYMLRPDVKILFIEEPEVPKVPKGFSDVFIFRPQWSLISGLEKQENSPLELVHNRGELWILTKSKQEQN